MCPNIEHSNSAQSTASQGVEAISIAGMMAIGDVSEVGRVLLERKAGAKVPMPCLVGARLVGLDLAGLNLSGQDLSGADLSRCNLTGTLFLGANLRRASLHEACCERAEFAGAQLQGADLVRAELRAASLGHAVLDDAHLEGANLEGATLVQAQAHRANFQIANLKGTRFQDADLSGSSFAKADLAEAQLDRAQVEHCNFVEANLRNATLANLRGFRTSNWIGADTRGVDFTGAYMLRRHMRDQNFLNEFRTQSRRHSLVYWFWWLTSDCGRSLTRWGLFTLVLVLAFAGAYITVEVDYGPHHTVLSPIYFSVVTMTTLGFGDVVPVSMAAQVVTMLQVSTGYLMLGGLVSILSSKLARRAD